MSTRTQLTCLPQFSHVPADLTHSSRSLLLPLTCVVFFYSPPLGHDLWTRVRWPRGQRAATGGKVAISGPLHDAEAANRRIRDCRTLSSSRIQDRRTLSSSRTQMHGVTHGPVVQSRPRRMPLALTRPPLKMMSDVVQNTGNS